MDTKDAIILEQGRTISDLQSDLSGMVVKVRGLEGRLFGLQRNFAYQVEEHGRIVEGINVERDSIYAQLTALKSSIEGSKSRSIIAVQELLDRNDTLTAENTAIKHKLSLLWGHLEEWKAAYMELNIYSRGCESLLHTRGFYKENMPKRPNLVLDPAVKQELED